MDSVPYCPEMEIGLGTPRETLRLTAEDHLVSRSGNADHTAAMAALPLPAGLDGYVFKAKSPSCGIYGIPRYAPGGQPSDHRGRGVFAQRMTGRFPLLPRKTRGGSTTRCCGRSSPNGCWPAGSRDLLCAPWEPRDLICFHARHKLQLLAHDPVRYRRAGRVVAAAGTAPREVTEAAYRDVFQAAMNAKASRAGRRTRCTTRSGG